MEMGNFGSNGKGATLDIRVAMAHCHGSVSRWDGVPMVLPWRAFRFPSGPSLRTRKNSARIESYWEPQSKLKAHIVLNDSDDHIVFDVWMEQITLSNEKIW